MAVKIVGNRKGIRALLNEPGVRADIYRRGRAVQAAAGAADHNLHETQTSLPRARAAVVTATEDSRENRYRLLGAIYAARG